MLFVASYQPSTVAINMNNLPEGVTVSENVVKETWIEGAIGFKSMASRSGKDLSVIIRRQWTVPRWVRISNKLHGVLAWEW